MKIFVSISAYDAILDASIASILCKKKLLIMKSIQVYHIVMKILIKRILKYFDEINYVDGKDVLNKNLFSNFEIPIRQFFIQFI